MLEAASFFRNTLYFEIFYKICRRIPIWIKIGRNNIHSRRRRASIRMAGLQEGDRFCCLYVGCDARGICAHRNTLDHFRLYISLLTLSRLCRVSIMIVSKPVTKTRTQCVRSKRWRFLCFSGDYSRLKILQTITERMRTLPNLFYLS